MFPLLHNRDIFKRHQKEKKALDPIKYYITVQNN